MKTAVLLLNFGEPEHATLAEVVPFLERIFNLNATLEGRVPDAEARARATALASARAPSLIAEYESIGGSPLHAQAQAHADALAALLTGRGHDVVVLQGMQFTAPLIPEAIAAAAAAGVARLIALPVYPLCGPTTTVAALAEVAAEVRARAPEVALFELGGWHTHPDYLRLRAAAIRRTAAGAGLDLAHPGTRLVFSAHGTPLKYLEEGSRYDRYVRDFCARLAAELGDPPYELGYQNHSNRPGVRWTQPDIGEVIAAVAVEHVIVDPVSFMHEQSETLAELDHELREQAEARGLGFHRVPIPHDDPAFIQVLADLVTPLLPPATSARKGCELRLCECRATPGTFCLNGSRAAPGAGLP
jgi:ferrochelatase